MIDSPIRLCRSADTETIWAIINEAAAAYKGVIPPDCWHEPYMSREELHGEIYADVVFWGYEADDRLVGVMGRQDKGEVVLIRHAYVLPAYQRRGIGAKLLQYFTREESKPILVGTWAAATWAIRFYARHGFQLVTPEEKDRLLRTYWTITDRQIETSVVLADETWLKTGKAGA
jgi:GNAT superfamily N-acetyltransferase